MPEPIVSLNEESLKPDLREPVGRAVEDTPDGLPGEGADDLVGAERHGRTAEREAYRAGHHDRSLTTSSGEVTLHMPKLKGTRFTAATIERYRRRETGVEEAVIEMCLAGVPTRRIEDASETPWGSGVSAATVSNLSERAFASVEGWRNRPLERACPYACVDGIYLKRSRGLIRERRRDGRHRRERRRLPRGRRRRRGPHRVPGAPAGVPPAAEVARAARRPHVHRRQGRRDGRPGRRGAPGGGVPGVRRPLPPQRAGQGAQVQAAGGRRDAEGHPCDGVARGGRGQGARGRVRAGGPGAQGGRQGGTRGLRRDLAHTRFPRGHRRRIRADNAIERPMCFVK